MTIDEAIAFLDKAEIKLNHTQELVFRHSWEGMSYSAIAQETAFSEDYLRDVGAGLWKQLSRELGEPTRKNTLWTAIRNANRKANERTSFSGCVVQKIGTQTYVAEAETLL